MKTHLEVETKFDADADLVLPSLVGLHGVAAVEAASEEQLDAEYFDTADLRLLRTGIGLRRRSGGRDAGWHLKLERTPGERIEVRRPLGRAGGPVPKALRDLVAAHVRDRQLAPVARLQTRRRIHLLQAPTGATLAEIADDEVHADALGATTTWRELEVELVDGEAPLLEEVGRRLRDAGARLSDAPSKLYRVLGPHLPPDEPAEGELGGSSSAGDVVLAYLRAHVTALVAVDPGVRVDIEDAVHKMRVATRRLRSAMATYRRLLDSSVTDPLRDELKWLAGVLSPVRDAEVIRDHLRQAVDEQPRALVVGPVRRRIDTSLRAEHRAAHERALPALSSTRYFQLLDALDGVAAGDALHGKAVGKQAQRVLASEIGRTHTRMRRFLDEALATPGPEDRLLHEVRKAAKRVRYAAESGEPVFGSAAAALAKQMEQVQDVLGAHQDSVVVRGVLVRLAAAADAAGESSFTYGRLHAIEERRADDSTAAFLELVDDGLASPPSWLR